MYPFRNNIYKGRVAQSSSMALSSRDRPRLSLFGVRQGALTADKMPIDPLAAALRQVYTACLSEELPEDMAKMILKIDQDVIASERMV